MTNIKSRDTRIGLHWGRSCGSNVAGQVLSAQASVMMICVTAVFDNTAGSVSQLWLTMRVGVVITVTTQHSVVCTDINCSNIFVFLEHLKCPYVRLVSVGCLTDLPSFCVSLGHISVSFHGAIRQTILTNRSLSPMAVQECVPPHNDISHLQTKLSSVTEPAAQNQHNEPECKV